MPLDSQRNNHLGSVRRVVRIDAAGNDGTIVESFDFDPYGRVLSHTGGIGQPFGYAGGIWDEATGLVRFGARDYDPEVGRWTAKDPILFGGGQGNLYAYVAGDPVSFVDPSGRVIFTFGALVGIAVVGAVVNGTINGFTEMQSGNGTFAAGFVRGAPGGAIGALASAFGHPAAGAAVSAFMTTSLNVAFGNETVEPGRAAGQIFTTTVTAALFARGASGRLGLDPSDGGAPVLCVALLRRCRRHSLAVL